MPAPPSGDAPSTAPSADPPSTDAPNIWRRWILPGLFVIALFVVVFTRGHDDATPARSITTFTGPTMGSTYAVKVVTGPLDPKSHQTIERAIAETLASIDLSMSTWRPDSELSRFNTAQTTDPVVISAPLQAVIGEAIRIGQLSGGAFDVTVGPLVNAWGFGPAGEQSPPDEATLAALRARVGLDKLVLDPAAGTLRKTRPDVYVDLSAIAPGHGVDRIALALEALGYDEYLVEISGELRARGHNADDEPWRVGIERPASLPDADARAIREVITLDDASLATSGDYRNYYERDGKRLSHTIDPRTGRPIEHRLASVSVVTARSSTADALATALNVLGPDEGFAFAEAQGLAALFIVRAPDGTFSERVTAAFAAMRVPGTTAPAPGKPGSQP
jgi:thiamine biosynthesis lipoprotein